MPATTAPARSADPWLDTDVIDERAPRTNQAVVAAVAFAGAAFGWPLLWALMALQLLLGLTLGRRWCLPCRLYFDLIQPRFGEGRLEDSRAPRLANQMGFVFLSAASVLWWAGATTAATAIGVLVGVLALLATSTGFCLGCELYRLGAHMRGISERHHDRIDPADVGMSATGSGERTVIQFTHPLCTECRELESELRAGTDPLIRIDVRDRPELAHPYGVAIVPTAVAVAADGTVLERIA